MLSASSRPWLLIQPNRETGASMEIGRGEGDAVHNVTVPGALKCPASI